MGPGLKFAQPPKASGVKIILWTFLEMSVQRKAGRQAGFGGGIYLRAGAGYSRAVHLPTSSRGLAGWRSTKLCTLKYAWVYVLHPVLAGKLKLRNWFSRYNTTSQPARCALKIFYLARNFFEILLERLVSRYIIIEMRCTFRSFGYVYIIKIKV